MKKILIVEDEPDIQELLRTYLEDVGYETAVAGDGVAALDMFHAQPFDLVLLDVLLPKIDGFGVCELIRRQSQVPILMLTALDLSLIHILAQMYNLSPRLLEEEYLLSTRFCYMDARDPSSKIWRIEMCIRDSSTRAPISRSPLTHRHSGRCSPPLRR